MDRIEFLKWLIAESPSTTQQLMAWLQRAKRYPPEKNKGWFKSFLKLCCKSNPWNDVVIEDVKNPYLLAFCQKHKFEVLDDFYPDTYIVNSEEIMALEIPPLKRYEDYL